MFFPLAHLRTSAPPFSPNRRVVIFSDFDGTVSSQDSLKILLNHFADSHWPAIEKAMGSGDMPESIGLQKCFDSLRLPFESALRFVLKEVKLDPHFKDFAEWVQREAYELSILSGGLENFIRPLLRREGLESLKLLANQVSVRGETWTVKSCPMSRLCDQCNHCKSASLLEEIRQDPNVFLVYVGDGHTDACAVQLANLVFAKGFLKSYCDEKGIASVRFESFRDVTAELQKRLNPFSRSIAA
jgi:2-hydroxy-3-keto-5-methylthiopentenyl-1-phosphate phosphatase